MNERDRLTPEQMDLLAADVARSSDRWVRDRVLDLITEVRERRAADGAAKLVCEGYTAAHRDRDAWKARANEFEAQVEMLEARAETDLLNAETALARATQAEAQAAEILQVFREWKKSPCLSPGYGEDCPCCDERASKFDLPLDDAGQVLGRTILAELEALREVEREYRDFLEKLDEGEGCYSAGYDCCDSKCVELARELLRGPALAAVDAARKGET